MNNLGSGTFHHTCFVVENIEKAAFELKQSLSIKPWGIWTITPEDGELRGEKTEFSFRVAIAPVGNAHYELIEPLYGKSVFTDAPRGFHHTCIAFPSRDEMRNVRSQLLKQGHELVQSASLGTLGEFCYFDMPETGSLLELLYLTDLPRPEKTIE